MFAVPMRAEGKDVLLLKTPDDIAFVDEILEIFSGSIVIHGATCATLRSRPQRPDGRA